MLTIECSKEHISLEHYPNEEKLLIVDKLHDIAYLGKICSVTCTNDLGVFGGRPYRTGTGSVKIELHDYEVLKEW